MYQTIEIVHENPVATVWLNRPEIHNAFNEVMIEEIRDAMVSLSSRTDIRVIVLRGKGPSFCAGADLNWMRAVSKYSYEENLKESQNLSECFYAIYSCKIPTIAVVHGAAIGGANGLMAACDIVLAEENTVFSLSEVKIGIIPACISPYIIKRVHEFPAKELMLTGLRFKGDKAEKVGLVNYALSSKALEEKLHQIINSLKTSGPVAVSQCKELIDQVVNHQSLDEVKEYTAKMIAEIRMSTEGQEGMAAFLEKRKPNWIKE
jgi:methylglutaconyl-CoA hydratase